MKNETARREIESLDYYLQNHTDDYSEESHTAMMMAVKALGQEPCRYWQNGKCNGNTEVCEDAISRQDVLDLAKKGVLISNGSYKSVCKAINELPAVNPQLCEDAISRAEAVRVASGYCHPANVAKELANLPPVTPQPKTGHWIPVSVRLPEEDCKTYLVCCANGYIASIMYDRYLGWLLDDDIVAWMPLPKPYKAESEDKCKNCKYYRNPDYTRCHECEAESEE